MPVRRLVVGYAMAKSNEFCACSITLQLLVHVGVINLSIFPFENFIHFIHFTFISYSCTQKPELNISHLYHSFMNACNCYTVTSRNSQCHNYSSHELRSWDNFSWYQLLFIHVNNKMLAINGYIRWKQFYWIWSLPCIVISIH